MQELIKEVQKLGNNGAVMYKTDQNGKVTHISPLVQCKSVAELYDTLRSVENAIHLFLQDLVDKGLAKN